MLFALVPLDELGRKGMGGLQVGKQPILVGADPMTGENWHNCDDPWGCYLQVTGESESRSESERGGREGGRKGGIFSILPDGAKFIARVRGPGWQPGLVGESSGSSQWR